jgi:hypothetical protein
MKGKILLNTLPKTIQCKCKSYRMKFVKRVELIAHFRCAKCGERTTREFVMKPNTLKLQDPDVDLGLNEDNSVVKGRKK